MTDYLAEYRKRNWRYFPLRNMMKRPAIHWKTLQQEAPTLEQYLAWEEQGYKNWALVTGSTSGLVFDVDDPSLVKWWSIKYSSNCWAETPTGGGHFIYKWEPHYTFRNRQGIIPGVDVRAEGGFVVLAPSVVSYSQEKIQEKADKGVLLNPNQEDGSFVGPYRWKVFDQPSVLPAALYDMLLDGSNDHRKTNTLSQEELYQRILDNGFSPGKHNAELFSIACWMFEEGASIDFVLPLMLDLDAKDRTPQNTEDNPTQVEDTVKSALNRVVEKRKPATVYEKEASPNEPLVLNYMKYRTIYSSTEDWLIPRWLHKGVLTMIAALPEKGKTWWMLDMLITLALGKELDPAGLFGEFPSNAGPRKVLLVQQEDPHRKILDRIGIILQTKALRAGYTHFYEVEMGGTIIPNWDVLNTVDKHFHTWNPKVRNITFEDKDILVALEKMIKEHQYAVVALDPFYSLGSDAGNYFHDIANQIEFFKRMRRLYGTGFIFVHHMKKSADGTRLGVFGSVYVTAVMEEVLLATGKEDGQITIVTRGKVHNSPAAWSLGGSIKENGHGIIEYALTVEETSLSASKTKHGDEVWEVLEEADVPLSIAEIVRRSGGKISHHEQAKRSIAALLGAELIEVQGDTRKKYFIPVGMGNLS